MNAAAESIFLAPWDGLDDEGLLAHYRSQRAPRYVPVADADEVRAEKIDALLDGEFEFNAETHRLAEPLDWLNNPSSDIEWHILLHKFYYAVGLGLAFERSGEARYARRWAGLIEGWMRAVPPGFIAADVTGRRVQNWIYSLHYFIGHPRHDSSAEISAAFHRRMLQSLHEQVEFLCANLTAKRNHRTLELLAIFLAGVAFPEMRRAAAWRAFALEESVANLRSDLLPDGVHCELSTDYHHLVLKNALNLRRLAAMNGIAVPPAFDACLQRGLEFSLHVHKPDGTVPSLSDGDSRGFLDLLQQGAALYDRADMLYVATGGAQGSAPRQRIAHFPAGGYSVVRSGWGDDTTAFADAQHLVFDCGPVGEGNHGHFDCLNVELAAFGRSLIVDPGRYTYSEAGEVNWRLHFRGTAAHNTVCVDGRQQTSYLPTPVKPGKRHAAGSTRHKICGPAPEARLLERHQHERLDLLHGQALSHEYDAAHDRCIVFIDRRYWIVGDWLRAATPHDYALTFQLGAEAEGRTTLEAGTVARLISPGLSIWQPQPAGMQAALEGGWVSARYGEKQAAPVLRSRIHAPDAEFDTVLAPWRDNEPAMTVESVAVASSKPLSRPLARALRIGLTDDGRRVVDHWFHACGRDDGPWRIGDREFSARWVYWREDERGRVIRWVSHEGAALRWHEQAEHSA